MLLVGWGGSSYLKASLLSRGLGDQLYPGGMSYRVRRLLMTYHFSAFYVALRLVAMSREWFGYESMLSMIPAILARGRRSAYLKWLVILTFGFDEAVHLVLRALFDAHHELDGQMVPSAELGPEWPECAICQDVEPVDELMNFCTGVRRHVSHKSCIESWYKAGQAGSVRCPVCRADLRVNKTSILDRVVCCLTERSFGLGLFARGAASATTLLLAATLILGFPKLIAALTGRRRRRPATSALPNTLMT